MTCPHCLSKYDYIYEIKSYLPSRKNVNTRFKNNNFSAITMKILLPNKVGSLSPHIHCSSLTIQVHTSIYLLGIIVYILIYYMYSVAAHQRGEPERVPESIFKSIYFKTFHQLNKKMMAHLQNELYANAL